MAVIDTTNCVATRSLDFGAAFSDHMDCKIELVDNTTIKTEKKFARLSVYGNEIVFDQTGLVWDITTDRESGQTETSSTIYFAYVTEEGQAILSKTRPYDRRGDLKGLYHPYHSWRYVGSVYNNGSSNFSHAVSAFTDYYKETFTSSDTFLFPVGYNEVNVTVVSGGGGGGAFGTSLSGGASGGTSSFGSHCSATGGSLGTSAAFGGLGQEFILYPPAAGGAGSGGDLNVDSAVSANGMTLTRPNTETVTINSRILGGHNGYNKGGNGGYYQGSSGATVYVSAATGGSAGAISRKKITGNLGVETVTVGAGGSGRTQGHGIGSNANGTAGEDGMVIVEVM